MDYRSIILTKEDGVATIQMNSPKTMNALDDTISAELTHAYHEVADDREVGAVILTGADRAFCAGGDLKKLERGFACPEDGQAYMASFRDMVLTFMNMPKPTIAAVNGFAVGAGFCIAMQADLILASEKAKFGMAFVNVGLIPDLAGLYTLPRLIGLQRAKELVYTGRVIDVQEAREMGIVNHIVPHGELLEQAKALAQQLANGPRATLRRDKALINASINLTLEQVLEQEAQAQALSFLGSDHKIGVEAFFSKKSPVFQNGAGALTRNQQ